MENFTPYSALAGGVLIGLAGVLLMWLNGRIAGISGILGGLLPPSDISDARWRLMFVLGLVLGGLIHGLIIGGKPAQTYIDNTLLLIGGGLLVGFGTRLGSGCTSGHGVCGIGRMSPRGLVATIIYLGVAMLTLFLVRMVIGGGA